MAGDKKLTKVEREVLRIAKEVGGFEQIVDVTRHSKLTEDEVDSALVRLETRGLLRMVWTPTAKGLEALGK